MAFQIQSHGVQVKFGQLFGHQTVCETSIKNLLPEHRNDFTSIQAKLVHGLFNQTRKPFKIRIEVVCVLVSKGNCFADNTNFNGKLNT